MTSHRKEALAYAQSHRGEFLDQLKELVAIPSISTNPENKTHINEAANWVKDKLLDTGMEKVQIYPTAGHPIVYGENLSAGDDAPTVLIYGHYDVQPEDPVDPWNTDPFSPTKIKENLYGRGTTDMKGQIVATLSAVRAILKTGEPPLNIKFLIEGEEEIGGPHMKNFIAENTDLLACDLFLNPDTGMLAPELPTITYALRGIAYFELRIKGPKQDLHSGLFGGVVHNPAQVMTDVLSGLHDAQGRVTIEGFYDNVKPLSNAEREEISRLPLDEEFYRKQTGVRKLWGEEGYTAAERVGARPTLEINGLYSGFIGEGQKTVIPTYAMAKVSMRLVPNQDPDTVYKEFKKHLNVNVPPTVDWEIKKLSGDLPSITDRDSTWIKAYIEAVKATWGKRPILKREGASVPVVVHAQQILGVEALNIGFRLPSDNMHGPNEKIHLPTFYKGINTLIHFIFNV